MAPGVTRRSVRGRDRLMTSEDGMVYSPVHSIGYIIMAREEEETAMIREAKQKFRKVGINLLKPDIRR